MILDNGNIRLFTPKKQLPIPSQLSGMRVTLIGHKLNIILETVGIVIHWDVSIFSFYFLY